MAWKHEDASKMLELCMRLSEAGETTFFQYAAHIDRVSINMCDGQWSTENQTKHSYMVAGKDDKPLPSETSYYSMMSILEEKLWKAEEREK